MILNWMIHLADPLSRLFSHMSSVLTSVPTFSTSLKNKTIFQVKTVIPLLAELLIWPRGSLMTPVSIERWTFKQNHEKYSWKNYQIKIVDHPIACPQVFRTREVCLTPGALDDVLQCQTDSHCRWWRVGLRSRIGHGRSPNSVEHSASFGLL